VAPRLTNLYTAGAILETREELVYVSHVAKPSVRLPDQSGQTCVTGVAPSAAEVGCGGMNVTPTLIADDKISVPLFVGVLTGVVNRPVIDETGFTGSSA